MTLLERLLTEPPAHDEDCRRRCLALLVAFVVDQTKEAAHEPTVCA